MNPSTHKRVVVRWRPSPGPAAMLAGYVDPVQLAGPELDLLTPEGQAVSLALAQVQAVFFVADFGRAGALASGHAVRAGTRLPGLLVRVRGSDRQAWEGILANGLLELAAGVWLTPVSEDGPWQRIYFPRGAVELVTPLEVVRAPRRRRSAGLGVADAGQFGLFGEPLREPS